MFWRGPQARQRLNIDEVIYRLPMLFSLEREAEP